uniref:Centrosomal protein of 162 kDa n=1 Tax=Caenorhabditis tropicalis TaxID=1561998 RepID=A0A1I7TQK9_9PELO
MCLLNLFGSCLRRSRFEKPIQPMPLRDEKTKMKVETEKQNSENTSSQEAETSPRQPPWTSVSTSSRRNSQASLISESGLGQMLKSLVKEKESHMELQDALQDDNKVNEMLESYQNEEKLSAGYEPASVENLNVQEETQDEQKPLIDASDGHFDDLEFEVRFREQEKRNKEELEDLKKKEI